jgi:hypothetical protein
VENGSHEVLALCRKVRDSGVISLTKLILHEKDPASFPQQPGVRWVQTSFNDKKELVTLFKDVEVVLNFIVVSNDPGSEVSRLLIDAAVGAGVKRFAPSEWAM